MRRTVLRAATDLAVTLSLWLYFSLGYLLLFFPRHMAAWLWDGDREAAFQRVTSRFFRIFFRLAEWLIAGLRIEVPEEVRALRGAVIVCNHASYLDPLLLIALFERHKTIVKGRFFRLPLFGWVLRQTGYLPAGTPDADQGEALLHQMEGLPAFFAAGGNLFVFPEGTRHPEGRVGPFGTGAFHIARRCRVPLDLLYIQNTAALFRPGRFSFDTGRSITLKIEAVLHLEPDHRLGYPPARQLRDQVRERLRWHAAERLASQPARSAAESAP